MPQRNEIFWVDFDMPNIVEKDDDYAVAPIRVGSEQAHLRPAVVMSVDNFSHHRVCTVVPFTKWKVSHNEIPFCVAIEKDSVNNLSRNSTALPGQIQTISYARIRDKIGWLPEELMQEICGKVAAGILYECL
jgi:mRNA-degrading endonuclease toxin of MazEF toxin-antitoxin module